MKIATWNVCTLYRAGAMNELVKEMDKYKVDICALQEIRWPWKGTVKKRKFCFKKREAISFKNSSFVLDLRSVPS
jgi:exonuclease III